MGTPFNFQKDLSHFFTNPEIPQCVVFHFKDGKSSDIPVRKLICNSIILASHSDKFNRLISEGQGTFEVKCTGVVLKTCMNFMHGQECQFGNDKAVLAGCCMFAIEWEVRRLEELCCSRIQKALEESPVSVKEFHCILDNVSDINLWDKYDGIFSEIITKSAKATGTRLSESLNDTLIPVYLKESGVINEKRIILTGKNSNDVFKTDFQEDLSSFIRYDDANDDAADIDDADGDILESWENLSVSSDSDADEEVEKDDIMGPGSDSTEDELGSDDNLNYKSLVLKIKDVPIFARLRILSNMLYSGFTTEKAVEDELIELMQPVLHHRHIPDLLVQHFTAVIRFMYGKYEKVLPEKLEPKPLKVVKTASFYVSGEVSNKSCSKFRRRRKLPVVWFFIRNFIKCQEITVTSPSFFCYIPDCGRVHKLETFTIYYSQTGNYRVRFHPEPVHPDHIMHCYLVGYTKTKKPAIYMSLNMQPTKYRMRSLRDMHHVEVHLVYSSDVPASSPVFDKTFDDEIWRLECRVQAQTYLEKRFAAQMLQTATTSNCAD